MHPVIKLMNYMALAYDCCVSQHVQIVKIRQAVLEMFWQKQAVHHL